MYVETWRGATVPDFPISSKGEGRARLLDNCDEIL